MIMMVYVLPRCFPPELITGEHKMLFLTIVGLFLALFYLVLPGAGVLIFGNRNLRATVEHRDPGPSWTEQRPLPVLAVILSLYGRMVAAGEWRDYGISFLREAAVFSVFRRFAESPLYRIEKRPKLANRQGQYSVIGMDGRVLKRGADLRAVLRVLDRKLIRAV